MKPDRTAKRPEVVMIETSDVPPLLLAERRARNTFALLALAGWIVALALLGHGGVV